MIAYLLALVAAATVTDGTFDPSGGRRFGAGFVREGGHYVCSTATAADGKGVTDAGVSWFIRLDQSEPRPIRFGAEGLFESVGDAAKAQVYLDITYADGSHLWGTKSPFDPVEESGWHRREVLVRPNRPIASLTAHLIVRGEGARVRFRSPEFEVLPPDTEPRLDGVVVGKGFAKRDFLVRDFPRGDWLSPGESALEFRSSHEERAGSRVFTADVADRSGRDRAVTLVYALPLPEGPLTWFASPRREMRLDGTLEEQADAAPLGCGNGFAAWPFGAVSADGRGIAIGIDPDAPVAYRVGISPAIRRLYIAFDLGFAPERNAAQVRFAVFPFAAADGFRGALESYAALYPEAFRVRAPEQGNWMAFHSISNLPGHEDFGFRFKEGNRETDWDDAHGILTFCYNAPATWWMKLGEPGKGSVKTTRAACAAEAHRLAGRGDLTAKCWESCAILDGRGEPYGEFRDTPWCNGIVWSLNSAPGLGGPYSDYRRKMGEAALAARYGADPPPFPKGIDGEFIDSFNLPATTAFDFDRKHFAAMSTPLSFTPSGRVGVFKGLIAAEYARAVGRRLHEMGRLAMANSTPLNSCLLAFHLDVMGIETDWRHGGNWHPMCDEEMLYRRAVCYGKPFCFLQNTDFTRFGYGDSERYMQRCLAYGMFPSYFSANAATDHYFSQPALYERDRPLFRKYLPLVKRVAEAGWRPVNRLLVPSDPGVFAEQFGTNLVTVFNSGRTAKSVELRLRTGSSAVASELVEGGRVVFTDGAVRMELPPESVRLLRFGEDRPATPSARVFDRTVVLTQTQFYPLRERARGYLCRYVDNPLCVDPDVPAKRVEGSYLTDEEFERTQREALAYGLDGLAYFPGSERKAYEHGLASAVTNAVNVPIIGFWKQDPADDIAALERAIRDPHGYRFRGKTLILSYWTEKYSTAERLAKLIADLRRRFGDTFLFVPDIQSVASYRYKETFRTKGDLSPDQVEELRGRFRAYAAAADGLYVGETHMMSVVQGGEKVFDRAFYARIVSLLREVLDEPAFRGRKLIALSAICGHENAATIGRNTAADCTRTLRASFAVAASARPDVILLPEWDEYNENTCFAPTLYNSHAVKRILRALIADLHGETRTVLPGDDVSVPNLVLSWRKSLSPGETLCVEALNVPDGTGRGALSCGVEVRNEAGELLKAFPAHGLRTDRMDEARFEMGTDGLAERARALRIRFTWTGADGVRHVAEDGLHPVDFAPANAWNPRVVRQPLRDLAKMAKAAWSVRDGILKADLSCAEPIRYVQLCGNGQIQYVRGKADSPCMRFRDDASNAVFQISALAWKTSVDREAFVEVRGASGAEWMRFPWGPVEKGARFRLGWISMATEPVYLRIPTASLGGVELKCAFPGVIDGVVPLGRARELGSFALGAPGGAQIVVTRFDRQSFYPSVLDSKACAFSVPLSADRASMAYWLQVVTMSGKTWRSAPWTDEKSAAARFPDLAYDFSPDAGDVIRPLSGERRFAAMAGGPCSPATLVNRNCYTSGGIAPSEPYFRTATDGRPRHVRRADGKWALEFDGKDDFVAFPFETVPVRGDFRISFEMRPDSTEGRMAVMAARSGTRGSLHYVTLEDGVLKAGYSALDRWGDRSTRGKALPGRWNRVEIAKRGTTVEIVLNGERVSFPCGLTGDSTSPFYLGWCGSTRPFHGAIADFRVEHLH